MATWLDISQNQLERHWAAQAAGSAPDLSAPYSFRFKTAHGIQFVDSEHRYVPSTKR
jgi:hypothetical protein